MTENRALTDDEECLLVEIAYTKNHPEYPEEWQRACRMSGPIGQYQRRALNGLLKRGLLERKRGGYANRYRRWLWRVTPAGEALAQEIDKRILAEFKAKRKARS